MSRLLSFRIHCALALLLVLAFPGGWRDSDTATISPTISREAQAGFLNHSVVSDFDSDNLPDLAIFKHGVSRGTIEIQLSSKPENPSLTITSEVFGTGVFAFDIDHDNNQDLIIQSDSLSEPFECWLNDGNGHFVKDNRRQNGEVFSDSSNSLNRGINTGERFCSSSSQRPPLNRAAVFTTTGPESAGLFSHKLPDPYFETFTSILSGRGPPLSSRL